ncbi:PQQ-dependent sugar dehydrogenase [Oceanimonas sp. CHS3-5]|uniref:PQQ-dependent sugar dehydrogenase n=1 Tax=Oceanimonas sp. CHS3-5 TaxID=3068186 RepID=UPI00273E35A0|nr:PQQ-dependent sugar dehydrogenase [Oceanimonas sp. CHS3-5]MDP5291454.1 PQQ-dependent sugar dehydrogenase [Oceanimonas sp. CHS3-5]
MLRAFFVLLLLSLPLAAAEYRVQTLATGLHHPWSLTELPDGSLLLSERRGRLWHMTINGKRRAVSGLPAIAAGGQGGLLDLALHPQFADNRLLYFSFSQPGPGGAGTAVGRARLNGNKLEQLQVLFEQTPKTHGRAHFGSRLAFDNQGYLFITTGDRYHSRHQAQRLDNHLGKILRLHDDGRVPADNPFVGTPGALPEIWSLGHRNLQGAAIHPGSGELWTHEHGPQGGDEVNRIRKGANYGWPVVTFGEEYGGGTIGEGSRKPGMEDPLWVWVPSIAPSGMLFYTGEAFPGWRNNLFVGALAGRRLVRLELDGDRVTGEHHLLVEQGFRIRALHQAADGGIYVLTDDADGRLLKLVPVAAKG